MPDNGTNNYGVWNISSSPQMTSVTASASGGTNNYGVYNDLSSPTIQDSIINGGAGEGIHNTASGGTNTVIVDASQITGGTATISQTAQFTTLIGASKLAGGGVAGAGTYTCAYSYNGTYVALDTTCH